MSPRSIAGLFALLAVVPRPVHAEQTDALAAAERAYQDVDFERQRVEATRALEAGSNDRERLAHIYRLLGISHAALNAPDQAKLAFMKLLAVDPDVHLEHVLSPRLRTPYMEARGYWDVTTARLSLDLQGGTRAPAGALRELSITLSDPLRMGAVVRVTAPGTPALTVAELTARAQLTVPPSALEAHAGRPLRVQLLDVHENVLITRQFSPIAPSPTLESAANAEGARADASPSPGTASAATAAGKPAFIARDDAAPFPVTAALAGGGVLALGIGVTAHLMREREAKEWNGASCEQTGQGTRGDQCQRVDEQRRTAETVAIVSYAAGGALLAAGLVHHFFAAKGEEPPRNEGPLACGAGPAALGLSCSGVW
jgi:hypothetical protein